VTGRGRWSGSRGVYEGWGGYWWECEDSSGIAEVVTVVSEYGEGGQ
jgi:hypothetical protein